MRALSSAVGLFSPASFKLRTPSNTSSRASRIFRGAAVACLALTCLALACVTSVAGAQTASKLAINNQTDLYSAGYVNFGASPVGTLVSKTVTLKWSGTGNLAITSATVPTSTARTQQFAVTGNTCGTVASGNTCTVTVSFTPAYVGYQTSPLIVSGGTSATTYRFGLNGVGGGPQAVFMPGILSTIAGKGTFSTTANQYTGDGGAATAAQVNVRGFRFDSLGNLYVAEDSVGVIRKIVPGSAGIANGTISTVAGTYAVNGATETSTTCAVPTTAATPTCNDGSVATNGGAAGTTAAIFGAVLPDVAFDSAGNMYIADLQENKVRRVDAVTNIVTTIAGSGAVGAGGVYADTGDNGAATAAAIDTPEGVFIDSQDNVYILLSNSLQATRGSLVRRVDSTSGNIVTVAGYYTTPATCASATTGAQPGCGDGGSATAAAVKIGVSGAMYVDPISDSIWIADRDANRIRLVVNATPATAAAGTISMVAGSGLAGFSGDGGKATSAGLSGPHGITVDPAGDLYISDTTNNRIRWVNGQANISTLAGGGGTCTAGGTAPTCGDGGLATATAASVSSYNLLLDPLGNLLIADEGHDEVRQVTMNPAVALNFGTVPVGVESGPQQESLTNIGSSILMFTPPASGTNAAVTTTGPTAAASSAFSQTNLTTCGPVTATSSTDGTLAAGTSCAYYVAFTPDTAVGNYTGTLVETDNSFNSGPGNTVYPAYLTQTINLTGTATQTTATVAVSSNPNPSTYGQNVVITATVSGAGTIPTGTVSLAYTTAGSTTPIAITSGTLSAAGTLTFNDAFLPVGADSIVATYGGDGNYAAGTKSSALAQVVNKAPGSADTVTATPPSSTLGQPVSLQFSIPTTAGATAPTGTVTFSYVPQGSTASVTLGTGSALAAGNGASTSTLSTSALPTGATTIIATYSGDANYAAAAPTTTEIVGQTISGVTISSSPNPSNWGQTVTLSSTVTGTTPTGTVTFYQVGTPTIVNMQATAASTTKSVSLSLPAGTYSVSFPGVAGGGLYNGWAPATGGTSWTDRYGAEICTACTSYIVVLPNNPSYTSDTAALAAYQSSAIVDVGTTPLSNPYVFTLPTPQTVYFYVPDGNFSGGAFTNTSSFSDDSGGISLSVTPLTQVGIGTIAAGKATVTTTTLPVGNDTLEAIYSGDANNLSGSSQTTVQVVNKAGGPNTDTLTTSNANPYVGQPVTFTDSIPQFNGICPTGPATFSYTTSGSTTPVAITSTAAITQANPATTPATCVATVTTSSLPLGTDTVQASIPTDTNYAASTSNTLTEGVTQVSGANDKVTAANSTITAGTADPLTLSVPVVAEAAPPAGTVVFTSGSANLGSATWPTTPVPATCPGGSGSCYLLSPSPAPSNIPLSTSPSGTPITAAFTATSASGYASSAPTTNVQVNANSGSGDTVAVQNNPTTFGTADPITFTIPVTSGAPVPTGTVTFMAGSATLGSIAWPANPVPTAQGYQISITPSNLPVGSPTTVTSTFAAGPGSGYGSANPTTTVTVNQVPSSDYGISATPASAPSGTSVTLKFTVTDVNSTPPAAGSTVTFTTPGPGGTTITLGTGAVTGSTAAGVTTYMVSTMALPVGSDVVTGTFTGDTNYSQAALTTPVSISSINTNDTVTVATNPTTVGSSDTITFSIPVTNGAAVPTGTVTFNSGSTTLGSATFTNPTAVACATGTCYTVQVSTTQLPLTISPATSTPVSANFQAGATSGYTSAQPATTVLVNQVPGTADAVTAASPTITVGSSDALTFSIPVVSGVPAPSGTVTFASGTTSLGTATWPASPTTGTCPAGGGACYLLQDTPAPSNIPLSTSAAGTPITAAFTANPNSGYASDTAATTVNVGPAAGVDTIAAQNNPTTFGTPDTLIFSIPVVAGAPAPAGTVTFSTGTTTLGTATWSAPTASGNVYSLTFATPNLPVGTATPITGNFVAVTGSGYATGTASNTVVVNQVPSSDYGISATLASAPSGTSVTLKFTVTDVNSTPPAAGSTVTFTTLGPGGTTITLGTGAVTGSTAAGVTTYMVSTMALPVGSDVVTGTFTGDTNYSQAALTTPVSISSINTNDTVTVATNPTTVGSSDTITFSIPVTNGAAVPTGTVTFNSGSTTLGSATFTNPTAVACGTGTCYTVQVSTTQLPLTISPATSTPVSANFVAGATSGYTSAQPATTVLVNQVPGTNDTLVSANASITVGSSDQLTFNIPVVTGIPAPAGSVSFVSGATVLGSATWPGTPIVGTCPGGGSCYQVQINPSNIPLTVAPAASTPLSATFTASPTSGYATTTATSSVIVSPVGGTGGSLSVATSPITYGTSDAVTFSLAVVNGAPAPAGTVTFTAGGVTLGSQAWLAGATPVNGFYTLSITPNNIPIGNPTTVTGAFAPANGSGYGASSPTATVTVNPVPLTADSIKATPNNITVGASTTVVFSVPNVLSTPPAANSSVTFTTGTGASMVTLGSGVTGATANGVTTYIVLTSALPVGTDTVTGTFTGDSIYQGGPLSTTVAVNQVNTNGQLTATPATGDTFGNPVTLTETVTPNNGSCPTGSVAFTYGGQTLGTNTFTKSGNPVTCTASIITTALPVGTDPLTATYPGDTNFGSITSTAVEVVGQVPGAGDTLKLNPTTSNFGQSVTATFTVQTVAGATANPTGNVAFTTTAGQMLAMQALNTTGTGANALTTAVIQTSVLPLGTDTVVATYMGDANYGAAAPQAQEIVSPATSTSTLTANPANTTYGTPVTLTETVQPINGTCPAGPATFLNNGVALGTGTVALNSTTNQCTATYTTNLLPVGNNQITATIPPSNGFGATASGPIPVFIGQVPGTNDTLTANPSTLPFGSPTLLTFTVPPVNSVTPTGTVSFYNGTTLLGTGVPNASGVATLTTSVLPYGADTVTAKYPGDTTYAAASPTTPVTVTTVTPISVITVPPGMPTCGSSVTLTDTITLVNGIALGGTVQFYDNGNPLGSPVPVPASGVVTLTTTSLSCTPDTITAIYTPPPVSPYNPSTGGPTTINVAPLDFSIMATPPNQTINPGDTTTYTVSLSGVGAAFNSPVTLTATGLPPGATVSFANGNYTPGVGPTTTTMTIVTAPNQANLKNSEKGGLNGVYYGLLLLPLLGVRRVRRKLRALPKGITYGLAALALLGGLGAMTGCGGGYFGPNPQTFTITVTGTSGNLTHSTTVTLTVR